MTDLLGDIYDEAKRWVVSGARNRISSTRTCFSADEAFAFMLAHSMLAPALGSPREMTIVGESVGADVSIKQPRRRFIESPARNIRTGYAAANVAWNLAKRNDVESICWWNPNGRRISDDGESFYGANYGQRWSGYMDAALELLTHDRDSRRAWIPIWHPDDLTGLDGNLGYSKHGKDVPCTIGFGLRIYEDGEDKLGMHVVMRSQAAFGVFPYDMFMFTVIQELLANTLGIEMGYYRHHCLSSHLYEREVSGAKAVVSDWLDGRQEHTKLMPRIDKTFEEATESWPEFMDACARGERPEPTDPIEKLMLDGVEDVIKEQEGTRV